jgi:hypothetical protein
VSRARVIGGTSLLDGAKGRDVQAHASRGMARLRLGPPTAAVLGHPAHGTLLALTVSHNLLHYQSRPTPKYLHVVFERAGH